MIVSPHSVSHSSSFSLVVFTRSAESPHESRQPAEGGGGKQRRKRKKKRKRENEELDERMMINDSSNETLIIETEMYTSNLKVGTGIKPIVLSDNGNDTLCCHGFVSSSEIDGFEDNIMSEDYYLDKFD